MLTGTSESRFRYIRWVYKLDDYEKFLRVYPYIVKTLDIIAHNLQLKKYPEWKDWNNASRKRSSKCIDKYSGIV